MISRRSCSVKLQVVGRSHLQLIVDRETETGAQASSLAILVSNFAGNRDSCAPVNSTSLASLLNYRSILHHKQDLLESLDLFERVVGRGDDVGGLAYFQETAILIYS